jgi:hypothetical protein
MHHLQSGTSNIGKRVLLLADDHQVTVTELETGEILSIRQIEPDKNYWCNQNKEPGRWPNSQE